MACVRAGTFFYLEGFPSSVLPLCVQDSNLAIWRLRILANVY
jgi:hypothetical protein